MNSRVKMFSRKRSLLLPALLAVLLAPVALPAAEKKVEDLWVLKPLTRPETPAGFAQCANPIDAFIKAEYEARNLKPAAQADKLTLLRRVTFDLTGLPPTPEEQAAFLNDSSSDAYEKVVDRLLAGEQHAVRYARHWLDVLRYADTDEQMVAAPGIHLWRDWVINALNDDLPYDQFVRAQLTGYRTKTRTDISATGYRSRIEPRPDDLFALGFLARGATADRRDTHELAISAVETVSTAFMGLTVGCAKCHDHMYDPILKRDFYAMKALFDPLVVRKITLATSADLVSAGKAQTAARARRAEVEKRIDALIGTYRQKLYDDRVAMLPPDVQAVIRKPENTRTVPEQKIADDYYPILRIDSGKIEEVLPPAERQKYGELQKEMEQSGDTRRRRRTSLPAFWTVEVDHGKELEKSCMLTSGDPSRPETNHVVEPGWPFAPDHVEFREGRIEAFSDWLTAAENPLLARVAVNRLWQWHFGTGLQKTPSDFGMLGGRPSHPKLLDWLATEFVRKKFSMKQMHRLMVTSDTYKLASEVAPDLAATNQKADPDNTFLWHFRLQRLEAEPVWDSIFSVAGELDLSVGGPSFEVNAARGKRAVAAESTEAGSGHVRRAAYITRGFSSSRDLMASFLQAFDADDGRVPCPVRTQTVTAPQSLFLMNSPEIERASLAFAERVRHECHDDLKRGVELAFQLAIGRGPSATEQARALVVVENDPARLGDLAWLLFNLDEFVYVR
jgi:hypothetical protein